MGYRLLGLLVWKGGKLFLRRRYGHLVPSRRVALGALLGVLMLGGAAAAARSGSRD
jgi:hypothetical protein